MSSIINIFHSVLLPRYNHKIHPRTLDNLQKWVDLNKNYSINQKIFFDSNCLEFLNFFENKYGLKVVDCFRNEKDGRFKSDLWRMCILYEYGGIYADIDQQLLVPFDRFLDLNLDFVTISNADRTSISNAFIFSKKHSPILLNSIKKMIYKYNINYPDMAATHIIAETILEKTNKKILPINETKINKENCFLLQEIGDYSLSNWFHHLNSFFVYDQKRGLRVMASRYPEYYQDQFQNHLFIDIPKEKTIINLAELNEQ